VTPAGITDAGYSYTATRSPSISSAAATANLLLRYRQIANATNKRSRTMNVATYVSPPMPNP
jgi:hypothetical protein